MAKTMAEKMGETLAGTYGPKQIDPKEFRMGSRRVNSLLFTGMTMALMQVPEVQKTLGLNNGQPIDDGQYTTGMLLRDGKMAGLMPDVRKVQGYIVSALQKNNGSALLPYLAQGLNQLGTQLREYDWTEPGCCAIGSFLAGLMKEFPSSSELGKNLRKQGLTPETQINLMAGGRIANAMEKRSIAEEALCSGDPMTEAEQQQYARDFANGQLVLELANMPVRGKNGERLPFAAPLRNMAVSAMQDQLGPMVTVIAKTAEDSLKGVNKGLLSSDLKEREEAIRHPGSMSQEFGQLSRKWYGELEYGTRAEWAELYKKRTQARSRIRAAVEEQKQQGKTSFQVDPGDVAWLIAEKVMDDEMEKAAQGGEANYDFLQLSSNFFSSDAAFGDILQNYCVKQGIGRRDSYTESELLGDDLGTLYDGRFVNDYVASWDQNIWKYMADEAEARSAAHQAEAEEQDVKLSPAEKHVAELEKKLTDTDVMEKRYQNVFGPTVDRDQENSVIIRVQRYCIPKDSEYENPAFEQEDIAAFGIMAMMAMTDNVPIQRYSKDYRLIKDEDGHEWEELEKSGAYTHGVEDVFNHRAGTDGYYGRLMSDARYNMREGFEQLAKGDPEPLGKLIGQNVTMMIQNGVQMNTNGTISSIDMSYNRQFSRVAKVLDEHPELKASALRNGMTERDLLALRATGEFNRIAEEDMRAQKRLLTDPPADQKELRELLTACVTNQVMLSTLEAQKGYVNAEREKAIENLQVGNMDPRVMSQVISVRQSAAGMRTPVSPELLVFGDPAKREALYKQISESALVQKLMDDPAELQKYTKQLMKDVRPPECAEMAAQLHVEAQEAEKAEAREKVIQERVRKLETAREVLNGHANDLVDVYGLKVEHVEDPGKDVKKQTQNLIDPEITFEPREDMSQYHLAALNVMSALSMDNLSETASFDSMQMPKSREVVAHLRECGIEETALQMHGMDANLIENLIVRRHDSLERCATGILNPARLKMKTALDAYYNDHDPKPLGEILGKALPAFAGFNIGGTMDHGAYASSVTAWGIHEFLRDHPDVQESARSFGLTDTTMATLTAEAKKATYFDNAVKAEQKLLSGEKLTDDEFFESMGDLVVQALVRHSADECAKVKSDKEAQIVEQQLQKVLPEGNTYDKTFKNTAETLVACGATPLSMIKTPATERFMKLGDQEFRQRIHEAVRKDPSILALRDDPKKMAELRWELGNQQRTSLDDVYTAEFKKDWLPMMRDPYLKVLDSCTVPEQRPLDVKCNEAEKLLGTTRQELEEQAKQQNVSLSAYIDQRETDHALDQQNEREIWMRKSAGLLGMRKEQLTSVAVRENVSVEQKIEQYKNVIRDAGRRAGMSEEELCRMAAAKHSDPLTMADQLNADYLEKAAEQVGVSREQMNEMAKSSQKSVFDIADALVAENERAEREYERRNDLKQAQQTFDRKSQQLENSANAGQNVKQLIQLAKVVHSDVMEALQSGREDSPALEQLRIPQNVSLDVLAMCEQVMADRAKNGNRPGALEQQIEKNGFTDMIMKIHQNGPEAQQQVRSALTGDRLMNAVRGGNFTALLGVGNGPDALEKAAGVQPEPVKEQMSPSL